VNLNADDGSLLSSRQLTHVGWTAGIGIEMAVGGNWTTKIEYNYVDVTRKAYGLGDAMLPDLNVNPRIYAFKVGLNCRLWDTLPWAPS
ncbi:cell envelope biogenesis protein OmpA, partial [Acinetobacter baumannii]